MTTGLSIRPGGVLPLTGANNVTARLRAAVPVRSGHAVFGNAKNGEVDAQGRGSFLGVALAGVERPGRSFLVLVRGQLEGFYLDQVPAGTEIYQGDDPEAFSTFSNPDRPNPIARVAFAGATPLYGAPARVLEVLGELETAIQQEK